MRLRILISPLLPIPGINVSVTKCYTGRYLLMTGERILTTSWASFTEDKQPSETKAANHAERLEEDPRWHLARRIAGSKGFVKSKFLTSFVLYICEKYLLDQADEITEQQIGEQVFRRPRGYNPGEDNIVRNYARLLRQRLDEYFAVEGIDEQFASLCLAADTSLSSSKTMRLSAKATRTHPCRSCWPRHRSKRGSAASGSVAARSCCPFLLGAWNPLCGFIFCSFFVSLHDIRLRPQQGISDRFWGFFFTPTRDTLLVPADSGLVIYQNLTKRWVSLAEYASGEYQEHTVSPLGIDPAIVNELGGRRYTSVVDLHLASSISQLPAVVKDRFKVRYAREVTLDDLKQSNVILLGSIGANPWVELFQKDLNFRFEPQRNEDKIIIRNTHPMAGEKAFYETDQT